MGAEWWEGKVGPDGKRGARALRGRMLSNMIVLQRIGGFFMRSHLVALAVVAVLAPLALKSNPALAVQAAPAASIEMDVANAFAAALDSGDLGQIYQQYASPSFMAHSTQAQFIEVGGYTRIRLAGSVMARAVVGSQAMSHGPDGTAGDFYYVRYRVQYPVGQLFEDILLERANGQWKVAAFQFIPTAPQ